MALPYMASAQTMTLEQCIRLADDHNPSLKVMKMNADKARIMEATAWDIDKTELTLSQDPTSGASPDNSLSLSQTIDFPTRYIARRHQLKAETSVRQAEVSVLDNQLHGQVTSLYYTLLYQKQRLRIMQSQDSILRRYEDIATKRWNEGEVRQLEPLNARRLLNENQLEISSARAEYASTQAELARLLGLTGNIDPAEPELTLITLHHGEGYNYSQTPEGQLTEKQLREADEAVKVERSALAPSLNLALRTQMVIKGWNPYNIDRKWNNGNFMGFEVGVGIPIFNGATRARVKAARKEREQLQAQAESEAIARQSEYSIASNRLMAARNQLNYYSHAGTEDAASTARISSLAYESGEISYIEYVSALQQSIETKLKYASAINDYNQAAIKIMTLSGIQKH